MHCFRSGTAWAAIFFMMSAVCTTASAETIGRLGPVYEVREEDVLRWIEKRLKAMEASGEMDKVREKMKTSVKRAYESPLPVEGLKVTGKARTFYYDPTIILDHNITDNEGRIVAAAGTTVNPLDYLSWGKRMVLFDETDKRQREYAKKILERERGNVKLVLTAGSPTRLMGEWSVRVYFDQRGAIVKQLGISQVPAEVRQEGKLLRIDEIKVM